MLTETKRFKKWWMGLQRHPAERRQDIIGKWLFYACKTVAIRGNQDQQKVVYTINNRYRNSDYKRMSRADALRVFLIVNQKQEEHRRQTRPQRPETVVVRRTTKRRIIHQGAPRNANN